jgi:hypothetical protein
MNVETSSSAICRRGSRRIGLFLLDRKLAVDDAHGGYTDID